MPVTLPAESRSSISATSRSARDVLQERVRQKMETRDRQAGVSCAATAACSYQDLMDVIDRLKAAGVENVGMVAQDAGRR